MGYKAKCLDKDIFHNRREHLHSLFSMVLILSLGNSAKEIRDTPWKLGIVNSFTQNKATISHRRLKKDNGSYG
jgi:hypothetical protein